VNTFLPSRYVERLHRLALGIEPIDAMTGRIAAQPIDVALEVVPGGVLSGLPLPRFDRHRFGRHALRYVPGVGDPVELRMLVPARRYVPRRLRVPIATLQEVLDGEETGSEIPVSERIRRPALFPGAAYDVSPAMTGLRGRVVRNGAPVRWTRIVARTGGVVIGRAHGDDRGEFLLLLGIDTSNLAALVSPVAVALEITRRSPLATVPTTDPLWGLPLETLPAPGQPDLVARGTEAAPEYLPPGPAVSATVTVNVPLGRITSGRPDLVIT
jgi:hypothetical protein